MQLTRIEAEGIHDHLGFAHYIEPVTVILGKNETGKSSLLGLALLAVNGPAGPTFPVLGKSPRYDWLVKAEFDGAGTVDRLMVRGKHEVTFDRKTGRAAQGRIEAAIGDAGVWSLSKFLGMSPAKRLEHLEAEVLQGGGVDVDDMEERMRSLADQALDVLDVGRDWPPDEVFDTGREVIAAAIEAIDEAKKEADRDAKRLKKVIDQDQQDARNEDLPSGTVAGWRDTIAKLNRDISDAEGEKGRIQGEATGRKAIDERLEAIKKKLEAHRAVDVEALRERLDKAKRASADAKVALERAEAAIPDAEKACEGPDKAATDAQWALDDLEQRSAQAGPREAFERIQAEVVADLLTEDLLKDIETVRRALPTSEELAGAIEAAEKRLRNVSTLRGAAGRRLVAARAAVKEARRVAGDEAGRELLAQRVLDEWRAAEEHASELIAEQEQLQEKTAALATGDTQAIDELLQGLREERRKATQSADRLTDHAAAAAAREQRRVDHNVAVDRRTKANELLKELKEILSDVLQETVGPIEELANKIIEPTLDASLSIDLDGGATLELIRLNDPTIRVPFETASESQQAVVGVAFAMAVGHQLGGWRRLLLDDLEHLDAERRTRFIECAVAMAESGYIDNLIVACVDDGWEPPSGAHTIRLEAQ